MEYVCVDRGSDRCPCILMESGQCYSCEMIAKGVCSCGENWKGNCPYTEYLQQNKKISPQLKERTFKICQIKSFSPTLSVITLKVPLAYGMKCKELGTFLMIKWKEWFLPISVLSVEMDYEEKLGYLSLAVNASGPKTIGVLKQAVIGESLTVKGPFFSGVINKEKFKENALSIVIAKGMAVMPLINIKEKLGKNLLSFKLDKSKLPEEFLAQYLSDVDYDLVDFSEEIYEVAEGVREDYGYCYSGENVRPNLFLMVSPYFEEKLLRLISFDSKSVITPNHSNLCCGEGVCGSCSCVDKDGKVVKACKCTEK